MEFVEILTRHASRITDRHVENLRKAGWTDAQIAEAVYIAAYFNMMVRIADAFGIRWRSDGRDVYSAMGGGRKS